MGLLGSASERWLSQVSGLPTLIWTQGCNHSYWGKSLKPKASRNVNPIWILLDPYLIFVISFTLAGFLNPNILHPKITKNTQKLQQIVPKSVKYAFFLRSILKILHRTDFFYTGTACGACDNYEVWLDLVSPAPISSVKGHPSGPTKRPQNSSIWCVQRQLVHTFVWKDSKQSKNIYQVIFELIRRHRPAPGPSPARPVTLTIRSPEKSRNRCRWPPCVVFLIKIFGDKLSLTIILPALHDALLVSPHRTSESSQCSPPPWCWSAEENYWWKVSAADKTIFLLINWDA